VTRRTAAVASARPPLAAARVQFASLPPALPERTMRWLLTMFIALAVLTALQPWLRRLGIGRLPGDFNFRIGGREYPFPFASTLLMTALVFLIGRLL
jgi:hypothetical protein